jgi:phenylacetate 2-hydroxylase
MSFLIALSALFALFFAVVWFQSKTDVPRIKNLPEVPGVPIFGNLLQLAEAPQKVAAAWAKEYGPVFQTRFGNRRVIFANSFDAVRDLWIKQQSSLMSRPTNYTFHSVVSSSRGFTIGTSPWDESCKQRRKATATALNRPAVQSYMPILDLMSTACIKELYDDSRAGSNAIDTTGYFRRFSLNTVLMLNYGMRIGRSDDGSLLKEIGVVESEVSKFRNTFSHWQDYIPILRFVPRSNARADEFRMRRDVYMDRLLKMLKDRISAGTDTPSIIGNILKDPEARLSDTEVQSICLSVITASNHTVPGNLIISTEFLASPRGQGVQKRAYDSIMAAYPRGDAWEKCVLEESIPYMTAFYKEVLRFTSILPMSLPRTSTKDIEWEGATIPAGTMFQMNAWAANFDDAHFKDPQSFEPERYMGDNASDGTSHYSYGAGTRMCVASHLANRELFVAFVRVISAFEILPSEASEDQSTSGFDIDGMGDRTGKPMKVRLRIRDEEKLEQWIEDSELRTKDL